MLRAMRLWPGIVTASVAVALLLPAAGTAEPTHDALVRPGKGIGKVELGMTLEQVKRVLGKPRTAVRQLTTPGGGRYLELQWEIEGDLTPSTWDVGVRSATRAGKLRVVRVSTTLRTQRTKERLGVGSRPRDVLRVFSQATCLYRDWQKPFGGTWVVIDAAGGMTAFSLYDIQVSGRPDNHEVIEVLVQTRWYSPGPEGNCPDEWRSW